MARLPDRLAAGPLELRRWSLDHLDALMKAIDASQPDLARWLSWAEPMPTREDEARVVRDGVAAFDADKDWGYFLMEPDGALVGGVGLHQTSDNEVEIGYWVRSPPNWEGIRHIRRRGTHRRRV